MVLPYLTRGYNTFLEYSTVRMQGRRGLVDTNEAFGGCGRRLMQTRFAYICSVLPVRWRVEKGGTFFSMEQKKSPVIFLEAAPELKCRLKCTLAILYCRVPHCCEYKLISATSRHKISWALDTVR